MVDVPGASVKAQTDFDGNYSIKLDPEHDSLRATCFGYTPLVLPVSDENTQEINFLMNTKKIVMNAVEVVAPENPAYKIMRNVVKNKPQNDPRALEAYQYELYLRTELDVDNMSKEFKEQKLTKKLSETLAESATIIDEYGNEVLPVFISENLSDYYFKSDPRSEKEYVKASKVRGVGVQDEGFMSQIMGATFTRVNFYENAVDIFDKQFLSPISDNWKSNYSYILEDTLMVEGVSCYQLEIKPKREQDLAMWGTIYISEDDYALRKIDVSIPKKANLNFIDEVKIERTWEETEAGPWLDNKTKVLVDISDLGKNTPSMVMKLYSTVDSVIVNQPKDKSFYQIQMELAEDANEKSKEYWTSARHDSLTDETVHAAAIIDSLNETPIIKTYVDVVDFILYGYKRLGKVDLGPYIYTYAYNTVEEHRLRVGLRTNENFSKKVELKGYAAYGTGDEIWKYNAAARFILNRTRWTEIGVSRKYELEQLGVTDQYLGDQNVLFKVLSRWGNIIGGYYNTTNELYGFRQLNKNFSQKVTVRTWEFNPVFDFGYFEDYPANTEIAQNIATSEVVLRTRFARNERFVRRGNDRVSFGSPNWPEIDLEYTYGSTLVYGDYEYHKLDLEWSQRVGLNAWGQTRYTISGGKVFNTLPYPLLNVHLGNEYYVFSQRSYNLMNFFEFISDQYVSLRHEHHFNGFIMNRIPGVNKLKLRIVTNVNLIWGSVSQSNLDIIPEGYTQFQPFGKDPYMEVGYGIENIFKIARVQVYHRLTYLDRPDVDKWGIRAGLQFSL